MRGNIYVLVKMGRGMYDTSDGSYTNGSFMTTITNENKNKNRVGIGPRAAAEPCCSCDYVADHVQESERGAGPTGNGNLVTDVHTITIPDMSRSMTAGTFYLVFRPGNR